MNFRRSSEEAQKKLKLHANNPVPGGAQLEFHKYFLIKHKIMSKYYGKSFGKLWESRTVTGCRIAMF